MKAFELQTGDTNFMEQVRYLLGIDAELLGTAPHLHARSLEFKIRVDAYGYASRITQLR